MTKKQRKKKEKIQKRQLKIMYQYFHGSVEYRGFPKEKLTIDHLPVIGSNLF